MGHPPPPMAADHPHAAGNQGGPPVGAEGGKVGPPRRGGGGDTTQPPIGGTAIKPVGWDRTGCEAFLYMLCDPQKGTILTRTPCSWLKIIVFYIIYYSCLATFWIICLFIFGLTLPDVMDGPKWQMYDGLIGDKPGVGIRPRQSDAFIHSQMIRLQSGDQNQIPSHPEGEGSTNADYAARVHTFFERYMKSPAPPDPVVDPYLDDPYRFKGYKAFDPKTTLGPCGSFPYGYVGEHVKPCIYIKLNKIWGWQPSPVQCDEYYRGSYDYDYECPPSLRRHLNSAAAMEAGEENIWIDCQGRNAADKEALDGRITYYPASRAIPISYFPYLGERGADFPVGTSTADVGFHPPLVAIQVDPSPHRGQLVHIECRAYYSGVRHDSKDKLGLVQFEVQID